LAEGFAEGSEQSAIKGEKRECKLSETTATVVIVFFHSVPFQPHFFSIAYDSLLMTKKGESEVWFCCMATFS